MFAALIRLLIWAGLSELFIAAVVILRSFSSFAGLFALATYGLSNADVTALGEQSVCGRKFLLSLCRTVSTKSKYHNHEKWKHKVGQRW